MVDTVQPLGLPSPRNRVASSRPEDEPAKMEEHKNPSQWSTTPKPSVPS